MKTTMRLHSFNLFLIVLLWVSLAEEIKAARRKQRCFVRICFKCQAYMTHTRGKRSLDDENEFDRAEDDLSEDVGMLYQRKQKSMRWTERNSQQMDAMFRWELPDEFDLPVRSHISDKSPRLSSSGDGIDITTAKPKRRPRHRRRSVDDHIGRCLFLLKSTCCRLYAGHATYIGYKLKF